MDSDKEFADNILDVSDDDSVVNVPFTGKIRRSSKESISSVSSSLAEDVKTNTASLKSGGVGVPGGAAEAAASDLRLSVESLMPPLPSRESSESRIRFSPKVRNSPISPRKMLVSTPVSGNFDFHGIMSPRRLSSRSASSPRLVLSGLSPKLSPKEGIPKISPRDLLGLSTSAMNTPTRGTGRLYGHPPLTTEGRPPSSRRTSSGTVIPPPLSSIAQEAAREFTDRLKKASARTPADTNVSEVSSSDRKSTDDRDNAVVRTLPGYPLQPSLQARRAAFELLSVEILVKGKVRRDSEAASLVATESVVIMPKAALVVDIEPPRKKSAKKLSRRSSDPCLPIRESWSLRNSDPSGIDEDIKHQADIVQSTNGEEAESSMSEIPTFLSTTPPSIEGRQMIIKPVPVRVPSPVSMLTDDSGITVAPSPSLTISPNIPVSKSVSPILTAHSPTPAPGSSSVSNPRSKAPGFTKEGPAKTFGNLKLPQASTSAATGHLPEKRKAPIPFGTVTPPPATMPKKHSGPDTIMPAIRSHSLFAGFPSLSKSSPAMRTTSGSRAHHHNKERSHGVYSPPPLSTSAQPTSPNRLFPLRFVGAGGSAPATGSNQTGNAAPAERSLSPKGSGFFGSSKRAGEVVSPFQPTMGKPPSTHLLPHTPSALNLSSTRPLGNHFGSAGTIQAPSSSPNELYAAAVPPPTSGITRASSADDYSSALSFMQTSNLTAASSRPTLSSFRSASFQHPHIQHGLEEVPIRKTVSTFPSTTKEKSPSTSPTTRSKRRASFNLTSFDATIAALKHKFKRKNSTATRESTSTPSSPIIEDRRTVPSGSINSIYSEDSEEGLHSRGRHHHTHHRHHHHDTVGVGVTVGAGGGRFFLDERRNSDALDSDDDSFSEGEEEQQTTTNVRDAEAEQAEEERLEDALGIPKEGTVEALLMAIGSISSRKYRMEMFESLFFSATDLADASGEQMTGKVADFVEDTGQLDVLELWLVKYRAMDKLRFFDPSVSARIREVIDWCVEEENGAHRITASVSAHFPTPLLHPFQQGIRTSSEITMAAALAKEAAASVRGKDDSEEEDDEVGEGSDVGSVIQVDNHERRGGGDNLSSASSNDDDEDDEEAAENSKLRVAFRLLRNLNRSELDVDTTGAMPNEWEHDFDEERGGKGRGLRRRKSESDVALSVICHARSSSVLLEGRSSSGSEMGPAGDEISNHVKDQMLEDDDYDDSNTMPRVGSRMVLRRATSLPFLILWSEASVPPTRTRREFSAGSLGSFSIKSVSSPRGTGVTGASSFSAAMMMQKSREAEDEEQCVSEMLAYIVVQPFAGGSHHSGSISTSTATGSPPPTTTNFGVVKASSESSQTHSQLPRHNRTLSSDAGSPHMVYGMEHWSMGGVGGDGASIDSFDLPISPQSETTRRRDESMHSADQQHRKSRTSKSRHHRQNSASQQHHHHYRQPSGSSLHTFLSGSHNGGGGGRRQTGSSSFSSFIDSDSLVLPERSQRWDIKRYEPRLVAEQMLVTMCRSGYLQVSPQALRTVEARKRDEAIQRMVRFFEVLSNWPVTEILCDSKRTASDRIDDFGWFVGLAKACRELGNYHAVFAIIGGLQSPLLMWVADIAHRKHKRQFLSLKRLVRTDGNYRIYHADLSKRNIRTPCIPYLGLLNRTLLNLQCDTPIFTDAEKKIVNFTRLRRIRKAISDYLKWQNPTSSMIPSNGIFLDPCIRKALAESMSRSVLDYRELSSMSSIAKSGFVKSLRQRAFHRARVLGHQIVGQNDSH